MTGRTTGLALALALTALGTPQAANALNPADADCVFKNLDPAVAQRIGAVYVTIADMAAGDMVPSSTQSDNELLGQAAVICVADLDWSDTALDAALRYAAAKIGVDAVIGAMPGAGIDAATAQGVIKGFSPSEKAQFLMDPAPDSIDALLLGASARAGLDLKTEKQQAMMALLASFSALADSSLAQFEAQ